MSHGYAFGDTEQAAARLALLAEVFAEPTRSLLDSLDVAPGVVLDLGCGAGHTSGLLRRRFTGATVVGLDVSAAYVDQAQHGYPDCRFETADVTVLPLPYTPTDLLYARFLLAHLPDPCQLLAGWLTQVGIGGIVAVEELEFIGTDDPLLARYVALADAVVRARGSEMHAGPIIAGCLPDRADVVVNKVAPHPVAVTDAARLFALNLSVWGSDARAGGLTDDDELAALHAALRSRLEDTDAPAVQWGIRQLALRRVDGEIACSLLPFCRGE